MNITHLSHEQVQFDFCAVPLVYQTVTLVFPGRQVVVDVKTGTIHDQPLNNQVAMPTVVLVDKFKTHKKREEVSQSTITCYHSLLISFAEFAPQWPPTIEQVNQFLDIYRNEEEYSKVTLAEYWVRLNAWFKWAQKAGYIILNPMEQIERPKLPKVEASVIAPQDFVKVIKYLEQASVNLEPQQRGLPYERAVRDLAILRFTYATGCRIGEVAGLRMRDFYLKEGKAVIQPKTSKTKEQRTVYFGRQAQHSLELWLKSRPDIGGQVFLGTKGNGWSKKPFTKYGIYQAWQARQEEACIGPYKFHEIRHSHVTHSLNNGIAVHHVSKQAGHKSPNTTLRIYAHSEDPERKRAYSAKNPDDSLEE
ncbi:MAG: tyrosine-type recombinase/integrase [Anaerolineae bacterium]|nr:tyrosine-type recombinase/integrase [Anaerolineae bacterium]